METVDVDGELPGERRIVVDGCGVGDDEGGQSARPLLLERLLVLVREGEAGADGIDERRKHELHFRRRHRVAPRSDVADGDAIDEHRGPVVDESVEGERFAEDPADVLHEPRRLVILFDPRLHAVEGERNAKERIRWAAGDAVVERRDEVAEVDGCSTSEHGDVETVGEALQPRLRLHEPLNKNGDDPAFGDPPDEHVES